MVSRTDVISIILDCIVAKKVFRLVPLFVLTFLSYSHAGDFWEKKEFTQWSQKECDKLLEDSPWSQQCVVFYPDFSEFEDERLNVGPSPHETYIAQLRSAKPVRQALARKMQMIQQHDTLSPQMKLQFDKTIQNLLSSDPSEVIIVHMIYSFRYGVGPFIGKADGYWMRQTADQVKNSVNLISGNGEKVPIARIIQEKEIYPLHRDFKMIREDPKSSYKNQKADYEFEFIFPRRIDGKEILSSADKSLILEFIHPGNGTINHVAVAPPQKCLIKFNVDKMKLQGKVLY